LIGELFEVLVIRGLTCPDDEDPPSQRPQGALNTFVAPAILVELLFPEVCVRTGCRREAASRMAVPKASVHEDNCFMLLQDQIGTTGQPLLMQAETQTARMQIAPDLQFGKRVLPANAGHHPTASCTVYDIDH
jgi:hypothetical protein